MAVSKSILWSTIAVVVVAVAVIAVVLLVPGNKTNNSTTTGTVSNTLSASQKSQATAKIKSNIQTFFAASTPMQTRINLLQNGKDFSQVMQAEFTQLANQKPSVTVNSITFPNKTTAKVNYTVYLSGQPVLKDQTGEALLIDNNWLVSDSTLCQLLSLGGTAPSICKGM